MSALLSLGSWLDAAPAHYWIAAGFCSGLLLASVFAAGLVPPANASAVPPPRWQRLLAHPAFFAALVVLTLCAFRWPAWFAPAMLNPDEDQMIAGAITLRHFPIFWKYVDGTTHGPLCDYPLTLASLLGLPLNHLGGRIFAVLLQAGSLLCAWLALRKAMAELPARLGLLPGLALWSFVTDSQFVQYSSELTSIFLLSAAGAVIAALGRSGKKSSRAWRCGLGGLLLGMVPFAKLQAVPLALILGLLAVLILWRRNDGIRAFLKACFQLVGGACIFPALAGLYLVVYGLTAQFWWAYIRSNLLYASAHHYTLAQMATDFVAYLGPDFAALAGGCMVAALVFLLATLGNLDRREAALVRVSYAILLGALWCVLAPGREYLHYLHFLVVPLTFLAGSHLGVAWTAFPCRAKRPVLTASLVSLLFLGLTLGPQVRQRLDEPDPYLGHLPENLTRPISPVSALISSQARTGDTLAVWGWVPRYYVETGLPQGVRDAQTEREIDPGPMREFYRDRYVRDFARTHPRWFIDAVGGDNFAYKDRSAYGHETFPALARIIQSNYELIADVGGSRLYRRKPKAGE